MRRKLRFSLSTLLVLLTVSALIMAYIAHVAKHRAAALQAIAETDGVVQFDASGRYPLWIGKLLGNAYVQQVKAIDFAYGRSSLLDSISNDDLRELTWLPETEVIELSRNRELSDDGLVYLSPLKKLSTIYLYATGVQGEGLRHLSGHKQLQHLTLDHSPVENDGIHHICTLRQLSSLRLGHTKITDECLSDIAKLTELQTLVLVNTVISDRGLAELETLQKLTTLDLTLTDVSTEGVERFRKAVPGCNVHTSYWLGKTPVEEPIFAPDEQPTVEEINTRLKELNIDGLVEVRETESGPWVSLLLNSCRFSDDVVLSLIKQLPPIQILHLKRSLIGDDLLAQLTEQPVIYLDLSETRVTDQGMKYIAKFSRLDKLIIDRTRVTDAGLDLLHNHVTLDRVSSEDARTTRAGNHRLSESLIND